MEITDLEQEAIELAYAKETGQRTPFAQIPAGDQERLRKQVVARELEIEQHVTHDMLDRRLSKNRRTPRRYMRVSLIVTGVMFVVVAIVVWLFSLWGRAWR